MEGLVLIALGLFGLLRAEPMTRARVKRFQPRMTEAEILRYVLYARILGAVCLILGVTLLLSRP